MKLKYAVAYITVIVLFTSGCAIKTIPKPNDKKKEYTVIKVLNKNKNISDKNITLSMIKNHLKSLHKDLMIAQLKNEIVMYKYYIPVDCTLDKNHLNRLKNIFTSNTMSSSEKLAIAAGSVQGYNSVCKMKKEAEGENACEYARNVNDYLQILQNEYDNCKKDKIAMIVLARYTKVNNNFSTVMVGLRSKGNKKTLIETIYIVKNENILYFLIKNQNKSKVLNLSSININKNLKKTLVGFIPSNL